MGSDADARDIEIKYLTKINEDQAIQINYLAVQLQEAQLQNRLLIEMSIRRGRPLIPDPNENPEPVGGYVPLRDRIKEAENKSREEANKAKEAKDAS